MRIWLGLIAVLGSVKWAVGGGAQLVHTGHVASQQIEAWGKGSFSFGRHPRTRAGFSADSSLVWLVTVDIRQPDYRRG